MPDPKPEPPPSQTPSEEDVNNPQQHETNVDRDGRERYPIDQSDQK